MRARPEKHLERLVLREIGRHPDLLVAINSVGVGYRGSLLHALVAALKPYGSDVVRTAIDATQRHRLTYGLGVGSPDLVGSYRGAAFGMELKTEVGVVASHQSEWHTAAARRGFPTFVVRSPADAVEALAAIDRARKGAVE